MWAAWLALALQSAIAPSTPAGSTASVTAALTRGDEAALWQLTDGAIWSMIGEETRRAGGARMRPSELIVLVANCRAYDVQEPMAGERGSVAFRCPNRHPDGRPCDDEGYGLFVTRRAVPGLVAIQVWENDGRSIARCGLGAPAPPAPPPSRR